MSKELEELEKLRQYWKNNLPLSVAQGLKMVSIFETALKDYEDLKEENELLRENNENLDENYFDTWSACERLKENSDYALMFVDGIYCLVDTKDNKFDVVDEYKINNYGIIDNGTQKKLKALKIIKGADFSLEFDESQNEWFLCISNEEQSILVAKGTGIKTYELLKEVLLCQ